MTPQHLKSILKDLIASNQCTTSWRVLVSFAGSSDQLPVTIVMAPPLVLKKSSLRYLSNTRTATIMICQDMDVGAMSVGQIMKALDAMSDVFKGSYDLTVFRQTKDKGFVPESIAQVVTVPKEDRLTDHPESWWPNQFLPQASFAFTVKPDFTP